MIIGVDFDGTLVVNEYPEIGEDLGAGPFLREAQALGARIILYTMRDGQELQQASQYCRKLGVSLYGVNTNPTQYEWTMSPKAYCHLYIDDRNLGTPLTFTAGQHVVNWQRLGPMLIDWCKEWENSHKMQNDLFNASRFIHA